MEQGVGLYCTCSSENIIRANTVSRIGSYLRGEGELVALEGLDAGVEVVELGAEHGVVVLELLGAPAGALVLEPDGHLPRLQAQLPRQLRLLPGLQLGVPVARGDRICSSVNRRFLSPLADDDGSPPPPPPTPISAKKDDGSSIIGTQSCCCGGGGGGMKNWCWWWSGLSMSIDRSTLDPTAS
jgi:hypothetical protein